MLQEDTGQIFSAFLQTLRDCRNDDCARIFYAERLRQA
jgi:hypothetical protein